MMMTKILKCKSLAVLLAGLTAASFQSVATVVEVQTSMGNFEVNLFDQKTPKTVENFLAYVNSGEYFNTLVHRSIPDFVVQTGGFKFEEEFPVVEVVTSAPVDNEPELSNLRGTIAMAKQANNANSATSQWFVNLDDNSANLDVQNGGFTVFGQVLGDGMDVVDAIAALPRYDLGGALAEIPLDDFTSDDVDNEVEVTADNLVIIQDIVVIDADANTHPEITPTPNTLIDSVDDSSGSSGGGSMGCLLMLLGLGAWLRFKR